MIQVFIVDDHASYRNALAFMLGHQPDLTVVAEAGSLAVARALLTRTVVDVALVDLDLPDGYGLDLLPEFRETNPDAAVIVLSGSARPHSKAKAIAAGAVGFLHKESDVQMIMDAIRQVATGQPLISPREAMALMREAAHYEARGQAAHRILAQLTPRERDVLSEVVGGHGDQAIADRLHLSTTTVRSHVAQLLRKLEVHSRLQAALFAVRHGLVNPDDLA